MITKQETLAKLMGYSSVETMESELVPDGYYEYIIQAMDEYAKEVAFKFSFDLIGQLSFPDIKEYKEGSTENQLINFPSRIEKMYKLFIQKTQK